jgi:methyl-accepting chemotaxis protein
MKGNGIYTSSSQKRYADNAAIASILVVLDMLSVQLADISKDVESSVNGVCNGFAGMGQRAKAALSTASDALDASSDGGGLQAFVHRVKLSLEVLLRRIESSRDFSTTLSADIEEINERLSLMSLLSEKLTEVADTAKKSASANRKLAVWESDPQEIVEKMTEQASVLGFAAAGTGKAISNLIAGMSSSMASAASRAKRKAVEDAEAAVASATTVRNILEQLTGSYEKMTESLSRSASMSRQLNMDIGQAVVSMQFQDRVSQRIEHMLETIEELSQELRPFTTSDDDKNVQSITEYWMKRLAEKSTMRAEREFLNETPANESAEGSIELF